MFVQMLVQLFTLCSKLQVANYNMKYIKNKNENSLIRALCLSVKRPGVKTTYQLSIFSSQATNSIIMVDNKLIILFYYVIHLNDKENINFCTRLIKN